MGFSTNDVLDEKVVKDESCGLVAEIIEGGAGLQSIHCCGITMKDDAVVSSWKSDAQRYDSQKGVPLVIDESKNHPNSCGLKLKIVAGGAGFEKAVCCGNELTLDNDLA